MLYWIITKKGGEKMSKILLLIVVLIVALGAFTFLGNKKMSPTTKPESMKSQETTKPVVTQPSNPVVNVVLTNTGFLPKNITLKAGTKVIWVNKSGKTATVSSDDHPTHRLYPFLNLGEFADGSSVQVVVEKAGKYSYHNHLNASETGIITAE